MSQLTEDLVLDRLIHEPGRLAILTVLSSVTDADVVFLQRATGLTKGNLSSHLTKLEDAGLIAIEKRFVRRKPNQASPSGHGSRSRVGHDGHPQREPRRPPCGARRPGPPAAGAASSSSCASR
jgi:Winged helix DNA-binding domain